MVALYCVENRLLTYWFMSEVLPTLHWKPKKNGGVSTVLRYEDVQRMGRQ